METSTIASVLLAFAVVLQTAAPAAIQPRADCTVSVNDEGTFPDPQPLFLLPGGPADVIGFWQPEVSSELLTLPEGEQILLACTGDGNVLTAIGTQEALATCVGGTTFSVDGLAYELVDLTCSSLPASTQRATDETCGAEAGVFPVLQIGFQTEQLGFVRLLDVCFDDVRLQALYVNATVVEGIGGYQSGFPRPEWQQGSFFGDLDVNELYTKNQQRQTLSELLGSSELGDIYVSDETDYYMARGHLSAKANYVFGSQQSATFWFLNAVPQWQTFNGGNWATVESNVRYYARSKSSTIHEYIGTWGVATLPNVDGVETELWLYVNGDERALPVPKLSWKLVHDPANDAGVALVGINNPYVAEPTEDYFICESVCDQISWVTWQEDSQQLGYSYCCTVEDFQSVVNVLPEISVSSLPILDD